MSEIELQQENARLKALVSIYQKQDEHLVPLPNGDLHRGVKRFGQAPDNIDTVVIPESQANPLDRAVAKCLRAAKDGEALTCLWCGIQYGVSGPQNMGMEKDLREHLKKDHPSVIEGYDTVVPEILMANLAEANARLAAQD